MLNIPTPNMELFWHRMSKCFFFFVIEYKMLIKMLMCIILYLMFTQIVSASGVGVTLGNLDFSAQIWGSDTESLFVINTGT